MVADLTSASSIEEFQRILREKLEALEEAKAVGPYLEGAMWDQESVNKKTYVRGDHDGLGCF